MTGLSPLKVPTAHTSDASHGRRNCGRPPVSCDAIRREKIMDAATETLKEYGYQAASMDRIAQTSGMSKKTLYQMFDSKQVLFEALLIERLLNSNLTNLILKGSSVEDRLIFGMQRLADEFLREDRLSLLRAVITEVSRQPEIGALVTQLFASTGKTYPMHMWFRQFEAEGSLTFNDLEADADRLFGMTIGLMAMCELTRCKPSLSRPERDLKIVDSVRFFLRAVTFNHTAGEKTNQSAA